MITRELVQEGVGDLIYWHAKVGHLHFPIGREN